MSCRYCKNSILVPICRFSPIYSQYNTHAKHTSIWLITWSAIDYMSHIKCIPWSVGVIKNQLGNFTHNLKTN